MWRVSAEWGEQLSNVYKHESALDKIQFVEHEDGGWWIGHLVTNEHRLTSWTIMDVDNSVRAHSDGWCWASDRGPVLVDSLLYPNPYLFASYDLVVVYCVTSLDFMVAQYVQIPIRIP